MTTIVTYAVAILAVTALFWQGQILRRSGAMGRDPISIVGLVAIILAGLLYETGIIPEGPPTQLAITSLMLALAFHLVIRSLRKRLVHKIFLSAFMPSLVAAVLFAVNAAMNSDLALSQLLGRSLGIFSLAVVGLILSLCSLTMRDLAGVMVFSISLVYAIAPLAGENWRPCDQFKCGPFDAMYIGPFASENTVAMLCGVGALCAMIAYQTKFNLAAFGLFALALYATESRTSQIAIAVAFAVWPLAAVCTRFMQERTEGRQTARGHRRLIVTVICAGIAALFLVGFRLVIDAQPSDFSNRGRVWRQGMGALGPDWLTGLGVDRWYIFQSVGVVPAHFPHSEYLYLLFTGGVAAIAGLYSIFLRSLAHASLHKGTFPFAVAYIVYLGVMGMTELYWNPIAPDGNALVILPLIFILARKVVNDPPEYTGPEPARSRQNAGSQIPVRV